MVDIIPVELLDPNDVVAIGGGESVATHMHVAADISDSTSLGRSLMTVASDDALRSLVNLGTVELQNYGASGDGSTDDTSNINAWLAADGIKLMRNGDYLASGSVTAFTRPTLILADNASEGGTKIPFITIGTIGFKSLPNNYVYVSQNTTDRADPVTVRIERIVNTNDGLSNPKALRVYTRKNDSNTQTEWALSAELDNYSNTSSNGEAALNGTANKYGTASVFAAHAQSLDWNKYAAATSVTPIVGQEFNIQAVGLDHPTANDGLGNRIMADFIAKTNYSVSGWNTNDGTNYGEGEVGAAIRIIPDTATDGYFRNGIAIMDNASNANKVTTAIRIASSGTDGIILSGNVSNAHISSSGAPAYGLLMTGAYTSAAIRIGAGQHIAYESTDAIRTKFILASNLWGVYNGGTARFTVHVVTGALSVNGTQVLGARETGWTAMTGTLDKATAYATGSVTLPQLAGRVAALQAALTTHGLIGT